MNKINCPTCGKNTGYKFIPKTQINPFSSKETIASVVLSMDECKHEFSILSLSAIDNIYRVLGNYNDRLKALENS